ncbi:MAG: UDP-N-acetylmuramoyl-tripeptide--D-alanyl-D-alanine ligase [Rubrivivax sp.]
MTLGQAHALVPGSQLVGDPATPLLRVHADTRTLRPGDFFVALRGERFDAHAFLGQARAAGASAALAERGLAEAGLPGLLVADALAALQGLAGALRRHLHLPLVAVTGSNGKTTVTQMTASILRAWLGPGALATQGNLNNHIGVPLTLLRLRQDDALWHRAAVLELGTNHPGEIAPLARLAAPTVALVNNAQREHQEFLHGLQAVARENGSALEALSAGGTAIFPAADPHDALWRAQAGTRRSWTFALAQELPPGIRADVTGQARWVGAGEAELPAGLAGPAAGGAWALALHTPAGPVQAWLAAPGLHNARNALAAAACALAAGAPPAAVAQGLQAFQPVAGRSQPGAFTLHGRRVALVDDSYNANPDSVLAAIETLAAMPAPRWLVLGDMGEVGTQGPAFHEEVGAHARARGLEHLWCAGELSAHAARACGRAARHFTSTEALVAALAEAPAAASVLVKGSRFMQMEKVVAALHAREAEEARDAA